MASENKGIFTANILLMYVNQWLKTLCDTLAEHLANYGNKYHFIPMYGSHFGGCGEAGFTSTKHHLRRALRSCDQLFLNKPVKTSLPCLMESTRKF